MKYAVKNISTGLVDFIGEFCACKEYIRQQKMLGSYCAFRVQAA